MVFQSSENKHGVRDAMQRTGTMKEVLRGNRATVEGGGDAPRDGVGLGEERGGARRVAQRANLRARRRHLNSVRPLDVRRHVVNKVDELVDIDRAARVFVDVEKDGSKLVVRDHLLRPLDHAAQAAAEFVPVQLSVLMLVRFREQLVRELGEHTAHADAAVDERRGTDLAGDRVEHRVLEHDGLRSRL